MAGTRYIISALTGLGFASLAYSIVNFSTNLFDYDIDREIFHSSWDTKLIFLLIVGGLSTSFAIADYKNVTGTANANARRDRRLDDIERRIQHLEGQDWEARAIVLSPPAMMPQPQTLSPLMQGKMQRQSSESSDEQGSVAGDGSPVTRALFRSPPKDSSL